MRIVSSEKHSISQIRGNSLSKMLGLLALMLTLIKKDPNLHRFGGAQKSICAYILTGTVYVMKCWMPT